MNQFPLSAMLAVSRPGDPIEDARQRQLQAQYYQAREQAAMGLAIRRRPYYGIMELVPPAPMKDDFQKQFLIDIEKIKDMHTEAFGKPPREIELGRFLQKRLKPFMEMREFEKLVVVGECTELSTPGCTAVETATVPVNEYFLLDMHVRDHPEDSWIDIL